jgi:hypothetical protein
MDITQSLKDTENSLRDFVCAVLFNKFGKDWIEHCGVTAERLGKWKARAEEEKKRQKFGTIENRLVYYADFYDIKTILKRHWNLFADALGELKVIEVWLDELEKLRNPDAHRRELLPHQKQLAAGIAGEIRTRIVRYRSKMETPEDYFPRIESVRDNLGNIWSAGQNRCTIYTKLILHPGDFVEYVITAADPLGEDLKYGVSRNPGPTTIKYQTSNTVTYVVRPDDVGRLFNLSLCIISCRQYHAIGDYCDDFVEFSYSVLPNK